MALIERILDTQIRPLLHIHGGDIGLASLSARGDLELEFHGACRACPLKAVTYAVAVRERLRRVPGVREVAVRGVGLSEAALKRVAAAYSGYALMFGNPEDDCQ